MNKLKSQAAKKIKLVNFVQAYMCRMKAKEVGLPRGQFPILKYLSTRDKCCQAELVKKFHISPAAITKSIIRLEKSGLVSKHLDKNNKRANMIVITDLGREVLKNAEDCFDKIEEQCFELFSEDELNTFIQLLNKMILGVSEYKFKDQEINEVIEMIMEEDKS